MGIMEFGGVSAYFSYKCDKLEMLFCLIRILTTCIVPQGHLLLPMYFGTHLKRTSWYAS